MNAAINQSLERMGIMTWEEDDNLAICHHCGLIRPEDDHCQCVRARMAREEATEKRRNRIMLFLFACCIIAAFVSMILAYVFLFLGKHTHAAFSFLALGCIVLPVFLSIPFWDDANDQKKG
jgi:uncharacterized paraquat-inducible protein A